MRPLDYVVLALFFTLVIAIGFAAVRKVAGSKDYFVAGGKAPWWLAGVSHHVSGYSGVVFVAYAAVAYDYGFTIYVWFAAGIALATAIGAFLIAPRWARLRIRLHIESPTEYLARRYSVGAQQAIAWSGVTLKLFDIGAKWAAIGVLLHGFAGLPVAFGILLSGGISLLYVTVGGLWADLYTDFAQFLVQILGGTVLLAACARQLGGWRELGSIWERLPPGHAHPFNGPYTAWFCAANFLAQFLSYNGGTWNLAARFIAAPSGRSARKSALLSAALYAVWPIVIFLPMWASPLLLGKVSDPTGIYPMLALRFLPSGLVGLVLAAMFAATMSMVTSDTNTLSAVITRDILPRMSPRFRNLSPKQALRAARWSTLAFTSLTLVVAFEADRFGGVLGLVLLWYGGLLGPIAIPMLGGLIPAFRHADARAAYACMIGGTSAFALATYSFAASRAARVGAPVVVGFALYAGFTWLNRRKPVRPDVTELMAALSGPS